MTRSYAYWQNHNTLGVRVVSSNYALHITHSFVAIQPAQEITVKIGFGNE